MRIGIVSTFPPYRGGIAQFNDAMARALTQAGHEVHCATWSRQYPAFLFPGKTQFEPGKSIADASMPATLDSISPIFLEAGWTEFRETAQRGHAAASLLARGLGASPHFCGQARQTTRRPTSGRHHAQRQFARRQSLGSCADQAISRSMRPCGHVEQFCERQAQIMEPCDPVSPLVRAFSHRPQPREARRQLGLSKGDVAHLFFGLIRPYKGLGVLIDALSHLPSHHKLLVAGECYENWSVYQAQIDEHGLQDRVQLHLEFIPDNLVPVFMQACDNVVLPYLDASQSGVTALALHHERRVVASDVGDLGTSIVPNLTGRLVPPDQPAALAEALSAPWHAQPADQAMAFKALKEKFSWSAWATQLTQLVQSEAP